MRYGVYGELHAGWDDGNTADSTGIPWHDSRIYATPAGRISSHCWYRCVSSDRKQRLVHPINATTKDQTGASISSLSVNTSLNPCRSHKDILLFFFILLLLLSCFYYSIQLFFLLYCTVFCRIVLYAACVSLSGE